ncbi:MAG TPA: cytochrome c [Novosphingobium sp.]|nr:cytochrome c [Novosphingobium sp.]
MTKPIRLALAALLLPAAVMAGAAATSPVYKLRHDNFEAMGRAMKGTFDEFKKATPSIPVIQANANALAAAAVKVKGHFPKGTGPRPGVKTEALPAIWERPADFAAAADRLVGATRGLQAAAATGDLARIQPAAGAVGGSCKNCHDTFRKPKS